MSTQFYYHKTNGKPLTLHAKDALISRRGFKAQWTQFHQRGMTTAGCFGLEPHKSELIESHQELFREKMFSAGVL